MSRLVQHTVIHFSGHVQGVGFRYSALQVAREYEVAGQVSNLADGRVRLEIEGSPTETEAYVLAVKERMHGHIRSMDRVQQNRPAVFQGFAIC